MVTVERGESGGLWSWWLAGLVEFRAIQKWSEVSEEEVADCGGGRVMRWSEKTDDLYVGLLRIGGWGYFGLWGCHKG